MKKLLVLLVFVLISGCIFGRKNAEEEKPVFYYFYSQTCPFCRDAGVYVETLSEKYPQIEIKTVDVNGSQEEREIHKRKREKLNLRGGVPLFVMGENHVIGFRKGAQEKRIEAMIDKEIGK